MLARDAMVVLGNPSEAKKRFTAVLSTIALISALQLTMTYPVVLQQPTGACDTDVMLLMSPPLLHYITNIALLLGRRITPAHSCICLAEFLVFHDIRGIGHVCGRLDNLIGALLQCECNHSLVLSTALVSECMSTRLLTRVSALCLITPLLHTIQDEHLAAFVAKFSKLLDGFGVIFVIGVGALQAEVLVLGWCNLYV